MKVNVILCKDCDRGKYVFDEERQIGWIKCELYGDKGPEGYCDEAEPKEGEQE